MITIQHAKNSEAFLFDRDRVDWHDETLWLIRKKRDAASKLLPGWELLRQRAADIKEHVLGNLDYYLLEFEKQCTNNGVQIYWAKDAQAHNEIVLSLLRKHKVRNVVKSKSMLTEECKLNEYLQEQNIEVIDTDLGERIVQLLEEPPSHIVLPAIHLKREDVGKLFQEKLGTEAGNNDATYLVNEARKHLREKFLAADAAITGVNFAIASTGAVVTCTNEGNADLGVLAAPLQIHCMGIEKIIPGINDLAVFIRLLARSATGQPITMYTSHFVKPRKKGSMHIVLLDNGRTEQLGRKKFYRSLACIRCGACMNTCPVYRRSGGHSYESTIPGPIGAILTPGINLKKYNSLAFASTLCGSCSDVCPVKINIHEQLYYWRQEAGQQKKIAWAKRISMKMAGKVLSSPVAYKMSSRLMYFFLKKMPRFFIYNRFNAWGKKRELPELTGMTFKDWYAKKQKNK